MRNRRADRRKPRAAGMPAVAVTDHGNLFAAANFYHKATTHGVKPIIGCEVYVAPDNHKNRGADAERSNHLVLLCENEEGYRNLIKLVSTGFLDGFYYKPRVDHELLAQAQQGTDRAFRVPARRSGRRAAVARNTSRRARTPTVCAIFSAKAISSSKCRTRGWKSRRASTATSCSCRSETGIPLVATNDCHYLTRVRRSRAGSADVHPDRQDDERHAADEVRHRPVLFQDGGRDGAGVPRDAGRACRAPWRSPSAAT